MTAAAAQATVLRRCRVDSADASCFARASKSCATDSPKGSCSRRASMPTRDRQYGHSGRCCSSSCASFVPSRRSYQAATRWSSGHDAVRSPICDGCKPVSRSLDSLCLCMTSIGSVYPVAAMPQVAPGRPPHIATRHQFPFLRKISGMLNFQIGESGSQLLQRSLNFAAGTERIGKAQ